MMAAETLARTAALPILGLVGLLAGCKPAAAPTPAAPVETASTPEASDAVAAAPQGPLSAVDLRRVCRAGLAAIHGQEPSAVEITGLEGSVVNAQWRAPVDGGLKKVQCRVDGNLVTWKPLDLPSADDIRWMNRAGDPVNTFALKGDVVTVVQTAPDGTKQQSDLRVPAQEEAA